MEIDWDALLEELNTGRPDDALLTMREAHEIVQPVKIGPTWATDEDGDFLIPERTLGWEIAAWCIDYLNSPGDGHIDYDLVGDEDGEADPVDEDDEDQPWSFTDEQLRFLLWWYAIDKRGRFIYRTGILQRMKGWGKDPLLAVICLVEFVGPCRFSHWGDDGQPVAKAQKNSLVQVTAVTQEQTDNTMSMLPVLVTPHLKAKYGIVPGVELWRAHGGRSKIKAVTSNYRALEGKRTTFTLLNETHHWVSGNGGHKMFETIDGNATKGGGRGARYLAITNAFLPGEDSVAERSRRAYEDIVEGQALDAGVLYDSLEADERVPLEGMALRLALAACRGDAHWLDIDSIVMSIINKQISPSRSRRMWLNQIVASEEALHTPGSWQAMADPEARPIEPGDKIVLGFDGGKTHDATALVAIRVEDTYVELLELWEKPDGAAGKHWQVNRAQVNSAVLDAFRLYEVVAFYGDVAQWESYLDAWAVQFGEQLAVRATQKHPLAWDMRGLQKASTEAHETLLSACQDKLLKHAGTSTPEGVDLRRHVLNAIRRENTWGVYFDKESRESPRRIDAYAALVLAYKALTDYRLRKKKTDDKKRSTRGYFR